ncbi:hypothetical protein ACL1CR_14745, partial [Corynebacterium striatum]
GVPVDGALVASPEARIRRLIARARLERGGNARADVGGLAAHPHVDEEPVRVVPSPTQRLSRAGAQTGPDGGGDLTGDDDAPATR